MTTICSFCGKSIDENNEINSGKKYLLCKCGAGYVPKGANSWKIKNPSCKEESTAVNFNTTKTKVKQKEVKMAKKKQTEQVASSVDTNVKSKSKGDKKPTIVKRIQELMDKKSPEDIADTISKEFGKKYNTNRVKETIKYIKRRAEKGKI
jgi:hypothetical protein